MVKYTYDAWGKVLSTTGSLAATLGTVQPFRYRGYVYDVETGLYYLRARYYNPTWGRFVNADVRYNRNIFIYCNNRIITKLDPDGQEEVDYQSLMDNASLVVFLKEETALFSSPSYGDIVQVQNGTMIGQPAYVLDEQDDAYFVVLEFFDDGIRTAINTGWIKKASTSLTLWDVVMPKTHILDKVDYTYKNMYWLKKYLQDLGYTNIILDNKYDKNTVEAVEDIQKRYRIGVDGKAGVKTFICITWEWLLYNKENRINPRQLDKSNNPSYAIE